VVVVPGYARFLYLPLQGVARVIANTLAR
jgi:hypothetical protein